MNIDNIQLLLETLESGEVEIRTDGEYEDYDGSPITIAGVAASLNPDLEVVRSQADFDAWEYRHKVTGNRYSTEKAARQFTGMDYMPAVKLFRTRVNLKAARELIYSLLVSGEVDYTLAGERG